MLYPSGCMYFHNPSKEIWCTLAKRAVRKTPAIAHLTCIAHSSKLQQSRDSGGWYIDSNSKCLTQSPPQFKCNI